MSAAEDELRALCKNGETLLVVFESACFKDGTWWARARLAGAGLEPPIRGPYASHQEVGAAIDAWREELAALVPHDVHHFQAKVGR